MSLVWDMRSLGGLLFVQIYISWEISRQLDINFEYCEQLENGGRVLVVYQGLDRNESYRSI